MKKILLSLAVIAIVAVGAIGATRAYFSDTATISGNTFTSGNLDLRIDSNPAGDETYWWSEGFAAPTNYFANLYPGFSDHQIIDIKNVGTVTNDVATIRIERSNLDAWNQLPANMNVVITYDGDHDGNFNDSTPLSYTLAEFYANSNQLTLGPITSPDNIASVRIDWSIPTTAGNDIMNDSTVMNVIFGLTQVQ